MKKPNRLPSRYLYLFLTIIPLAVVLLGIQLALAGQIETVEEGTLYYDMVLDEANGRIFASNSAANQLDVIDINTLSVVMTIPVGTDPRGIDLNPADDELAVAIHGQEHIKFISLTTLSVTAIVTPQIMFPPSLPNDVIYGRPGRLYSVGSSTFGDDHVHVIDTVTKTEVGTSTWSIGSTPRLAITADNNTLFVGESLVVPPKAYRFDITTDTPVRTAVGPFGLMNMHTIAINPDGSKLYTSLGQVWNGDLDTQIGTFSPNGLQIEYIAAKNRFYISSGNQIIEYTADNYFPLRFFTLAGTAGVARPNAAGTVLYVNTDAGMETVSIANTGTPPSALSISGQMTGPLAVTHTFTASVEPISTTTPLIYTWQATDHPQTIHSSNLNDPMSYIWDTPGPKQITVTVSNVTEVILTATHTITMTGPPIPDPVTYFDIVIDESRNRIYGSDQIGDLIHVVDISSLNVITSVVMGTGSEPVGIDISPDGSELAVALSDAGQIAFINLDTLQVTAHITPTAQFPPTEPWDVLYGRPGRLYSSARWGNDRIHVYDTVTKTEIGQSDTGVASGTRLAMTADQNTLFAGEALQFPQKIKRYDITTDHPIQTAIGPHGPMLVETLAVNPDGSKVYTSPGQVWNGDLDTQLGSFADFGYEIEYVASTNRFYISTNSQIVEYDGETYLPLAYHPISRPAGVARVNAAATILYVSTDFGIEAILLTGTFEPPAAVSIDGPGQGLLSTFYTFTATVSPPTATVPMIYGWQATDYDLVYQSNGTSDTISYAWLTAGLKTITVTAKNISGQVVTTTHTIDMTGAPVPDPVPYFDIVIDESRQLIYGSDPNGNLIHVIDLNSLDVVTSIPVGIGANPTGLDISPDGSELAAALNGLGELAFIDLDTLLVTDRIKPYVSGEERPYDVIYGRPGRLYSSGSPGASGFDYIHTIDLVNKVEVGRTNVIIRFSPRLAITADNNTLYLSNAPSTQEIYRFNVIFDNPSQTGRVSTMVDTLTVTPDGSKVFSSLGSVWNGDLTNQIGTFSPTGSEIEYSPATDRFFISQGNQINEFNADDYSFIRSYPVSGAAGVARLNQAETQLFVSTPTGIEMVTLELPITNIDQLTINGPTTGLLAQNYTFTATVAPISATQPITYIWEIEDHGTFTFTNQGIQHSQTINWTTAGTKTIFVTAINSGGSVTNSFEILIEPYKIYLPVVLKP